MILRVFSSNNYIRVQFNLLHGPSRSRILSTEKSKKAIRRGNRAFVTKVIQTANDAIVKFGGTQVEKDILEGYKVTLMDKKESIKKLDEDILNEIEDEDKITEDIFQAGEVGESINRMIVRIDNVLKAVAVSNVPSQGLGTSVFSETQHIHPLPTKAKLPKLSLKKFTGNPIDWQSFYDSYTATSQARVIIPSRGYG